MHCPGLYDGTSADGKSRHRIGYRLRLERDPHRMRGLFDVDEVIQIEHNLLAARLPLIASQQCSRPDWKASSRRGEPSKHWIKVKNSSRPGLADASAPLICIKVALRRLRYLNAGLS
jgi:hypothetical protein